MVNSFFFFFTFHLLGFSIGAACGRCRTGLEEIDFDFLMIRSGFLSDFAAQPPKTLSANIISIRFNLIAKKSEKFMLFKSLFHLFKSVLLLLTGIYQPSLYQIFYLFFRYYTIITTRTN
jgi:hypothetical protein